MNEQIEEKKEVLSAETSSKPERKRKVDNNLELGIIRVKLPQSVGRKAKEVVAKLRERGAEITTDELLSEYLEGISERYFEDQLLQRTPEPYYLEAATKVPELREMLIRHAKKGLIRKSMPENQRKPQRHRRTEPSAEVNINQSTTMPETEE